jgi:1,4-dihydroxy-2-naphthoate octaprenyltransferase
MVNGQPRVGLGRALSAWLALARLPFHSVGVLPFLLGGLLAWRLTATFDWAVLGWGTVGVILVMLATYFAGEYWDVEEDALSARLGPSRFAGGSQIILRGLLPRHAPLRASLVSLVLAVVVALVLQVGYRTGPWTVPFCLLGLLGGFFYSARPVRWVSRGWGELWIAFCYGWLPVAVGCYLQMGEIPPLVHWLSLPIGLTILNVILLNEFPDHAADAAAGKANLLVRLGPEWGATLYALVAAASWATVALSIRRGVPARLLWLYLPVLALSIAVVLNVLRGRWRDRPALERLCAANLGVNLGTTAAYMLALAW